MFMQVTGLQFSFNIADCYFVLFLFFIKMGSHYVVQPSLECIASRDPHVSASPVARSRGISHCVPSSERYICVCVCIYIYMYVYQEVLYNPFLKIDRYWTAYPTRFTKSVLSCFICEKLSSWMISLLSVNLVFFTLIILFLFFIVSVKYFMVNCTSFVNPYQKHWLWF